MEEFPIYLKYILCFHEWWIPELGCFCLMKIHSFTYTCIHSFNAYPILNALLGAIRGFKDV